MEPRSTYRSRWGRIIVLSVFWGTTAYLSVALLGSVAVSLYARPPPQGTLDAAQLGEQCLWRLNKLTGLKDELDAELTHELARTSTPKARTTRERWERWSTSWESELNDASARCSTGIDSHMAAGYQKLRELYDGYCAGLLRIVRSPH